MLNELLLYVEPINTCGAASFLQKSCAAFCRVAYTTAGLDPHGEVLAELPAELLQAWDKICSQRSAQHTALAVLALPGFMAVGRRI